MGNGSGAQSEAVAVGRATSTVTSTVETSESFHAPVLKALPAY